MSRELLPSLLDEAFFTAEGDPAALYTDGCLHPEEEAAVARAVATRRVQYGAARLLARRLFSKCGLPPASVLNRQDRSPIWPSGYLGSITHTPGWCGVVLARDADVRGVGIDAEAAKRMEDAVMERVTSKGEREAMRASGFEPAAVATLWFSAKESVYKCLYPRVQRFIGFAEVELSVNFTARRFLVSAAGDLLREHGALVDELQGRFIGTDGLWVTSCVLR